jgi:ADP-ribose pyrophosphatase
MSERTLSTRSAFRGKLLHVEVVDVELPGGRRAFREICRHPGAAVILAQAADDRFVFVRQYRKAIERETIEVVAGTLHPGEDPVACAHRELREETGYAARQLEALGAVVPAPGYTDERLHVFYARLEAQPPATLATDADELLAVEYLTAAEIERRIARAEIEDAKTLAAWLLFRSRHPAGGQTP